MARDFDGVDDNLNFGSDSSIDDESLRTVCLWVRRDTSLQRNSMVAKGLSNNIWDFAFGVANNNPSVTQAFSSGNVSWRMTSTVVSGDVAHLAFSWDVSAGGNVPNFYKNGASDTAIGTAGSGTPNSDAAKSMFMGTNDANGFDFDGAIGWFVFSNRILDAADINRAKYWGRPKGGMRLYHPLVTDKLANEGAAVGDATASGTTVTSMPVPVVRPGAALMGMGVGW